MSACSVSELHTADALSVCVNHGLTHSTDCVAAHYSAACMQGMHKLNKSVCIQEHVRFVQRIVASFWLRGSVYDRKEFRTLTNGAVWLDVAQVALVQKPDRHVAHVPGADAVVGLHGTDTIRTRTFRCPADNPQTESTLRMSL